MVFFKDGAISFGTSEVREFWIVLLRFRILEGGGGIENFKNLEGGHRKFTNNLNRGPVKI
jgi:hypothetical protein